MDRIVHRIRSKLYPNTVPRSAAAVLPAEKEVFALFERFSPKYRLQLAEERQARTPRARRAARRQRWQAIVAARHASHAVVPS